MARKRTVKKPASPYKKLLENTETLAHSQVYSELYNKISREGRLSRLLAVVQYCSIQGYDINKSTEFIVNSFPGYIDEKDFTPDTFREMMKAHSDIAQAWGYGQYGDKISDIIVKNKALELVEKTDTIEDIRAYIEIFGNSQQVEQGAQGTTMNFVINK